MEPLVPESDEVLQERLLDEIVLQLICAEHTLLEERLKVLLAPRPWWLPRRLWLRVTRRLLVVRSYR